MIVKLLIGKRSYSMEAYYNTLSNKKSDRSSVIVYDSVKLNIFWDLHCFMPFSPFLRHYVSFIKNKLDDILQNMKFTNQKTNAIIKKRRQTP
jgi:hypothetical protein